MIYRTCSWCHSTNAETERWCQSCRHEAHAARLDCTCPRCSRARRRAVAGDAPAPPVPVLTEVLNRLRQGAAQEDDSPTDGAANPEGDVAMPRKSKVIVPVTREVTRTPVSPALAAAIRHMDDLLVAEFHLDVAYCLLARGSVVAASNSRDGYLPPVVNEATADRSSGGKGTADDE